MQVIGLGLDFQHRHSYGKPLTELLDDLAPRLSHLSIVGLVTDEHANSFRKMTDLPIVHHFAGVAPCGATGINRHALRRQHDISHIIDAVWCLEDIGIWNIGPYHIPYFAPPVLCQAVLDQAIVGVQLIQQTIDIPFYAELPSCSFVAGDMSLGTFFHRLIEKTDCGVVLDVSHVFSYARYCEQNPLDVLMSLPLDHVGEIHVAGGSIHPQYPWRYRDTHTEPVLTQVSSLLDSAIPLCPNLRAITYEIGARIDPALIDQEILRLQQIAMLRGFAPQLSTGTKQ
ncbi:multinuclear nonheme iron-dependent oxidase [Burkholderia cenocepacia]|uniref:multinuclear nonheme iron-dependent oxidase n=1 Tax=Burkholderia cenocepacia TaxID=95486 RepID=UPI000F5AE390|nr:DUF692 family multinuclear iron-containing protein [Burkholderia cenocepacia]RQU50041.1 DUF692 family protein [Burkholderia cenocepacia]RQV33877.1 DUF692 family protein [Burkholderia cenocepacia]